MERTELERTSVADPYAELMRFVEKHPLCYYIMRSAIFLQVLKSLINAKSVVKLKIAFPYVEESDLEQILEVLIKANLVSRFRAGSKEFYYATQLGKKFLELYEKTKSKFLGAT